jgi:NCS1 family nucleobase:cation symporter-1
MPDVIEEYTISHIPENKRFGKANSLLTFWFAVLSSVYTVLLGAVAIEFGLSLWAAIAAIVLGSAIGGVFTCYHSAQGPKLGLPQLIQTRAQFGFFGALIPNGFIWLITLGFIVAFNVLVGQALASLIHVTFAEALAINGAVTWLVVLYGYRIMHDINRVVSVLALVLFAILLVRLIQHVPHVHYAAGPFKFSTFLLATSLFVSGEIGNAPYVSDYSRYLPRDTSVRATFWYTYVGSVGSMILFETLGALAGVVALDKLNTDSVGYLAGLVPSAEWLVTLVLLASLLAGNAENLYSPLLIGLSMISKDGGKAPGAWVRAIGTAAMMTVASVVAVTVSNNFLTDLAGFMGLLLYIVIPWSAINLIDYYLIRRGRYSVQDILSLHGKYGLFNVRAVTIFAIGIAAEVPFMNIPWPKYEGPVASSLGGADISWLVGFAVTGLLYYFFANPSTDVAEDARSESISQPTRILSAAGALTSDAGAALH